MELGPQHLALRDQETNLHYILLEMRVVPKHFLQRVEGFNIIGNETSQGFEGQDAATGEALAFTFLVVALLVVGGPDDHIHKFVLLNFDGEHMRERAQSSAGVLPDSWVSGHARVDEPLEDILHVIGDA